MPNIVCYIVFTVIIFFFLILSKNPGLQCVLCRAYYHTAAVQLTTDTAACNINVGYVCKLLLDICCLSYN
jgi:hypothetical protein